jgi:hypothetical protein
MLKKGLEGEAVHFTWVRIRSRPENAKKLLIAAGILFLVGAGVCGVLLT